MVCAQRTRYESPAGDTALTSYVTGQAEDETAPAGQHRTADRLAEKAGKRRVVSNSPCRQAGSAQSAVLSAGGGRKVWKDAASRSIWCVCTNFPLVGRVALAVDPSRCSTRVLDHFTYTPLYQP